MDIYASFAKAYDCFFENENYNKWDEYLFRLITDCGLSAESILDLGCGTGRLLVLLAKRYENTELYGIDISSDMLMIAQSAADENGLSVRFSNQDMEFFKMYNPVKLVISAHDCVNYLTEDGSAEGCFKSVYAALQNGGAFIFDVNTAYKFENVLDKKSFVYDAEEIFCVWENEYDEDSKCCDFILNLFFKEKDANEMYVRETEIHTERAYDSEWLERTLLDAGFASVRFYHEFTAEEPRANSERIFAIAFKE